MKRNAFYLLTLLLTASWFTACSDDDDIFEENHTYIPQDSSQDVVSNKLVHYINLKDLKASGLKLNTLSKFDFKLPGNSPLHFDIENDGVTQHLIPSLKEALKDSLLVLPLKVTPKGNPEQARNVLLVIWDGEDEPANRASGGGFLSEYSDVIGKGTMRQLAIGNTVSAAVFNIDELKKNTKYVDVNSTKNTESNVFVEQNSYQETMTQWGVNIGISATCVLKPKVPSSPAIFDLGGGDLEILSYKPHLTSGVSARSFLGAEGSTTLSGAINFGIEGATKASERYEYFLHHYIIHKSEVSIQMNNFESNAIHPKPDAKLFQLLDSTYVRSLCWTDSTIFDPGLFFDTYGTDIITQGVFGGSLTNIYGRKENSYSNSLGVDVEAYLRASKGTDTGNQWMNLYLAKSGNTPHLGGNADISWMNEEYQQVSQCFSYTTLVGGDPHQDPDEWSKGLEGSDDTSTWSLVGYRLKKDEGQPDSITFLYPHESMFVNVLYAYASRVDTLTAADQIRLKHCLANIRALRDSKPAYIESHLKKIEKKAPMVVADFMMLRSDNGHKENRLYRTDIKGPDNKKRLYRPLVVNKWAPGDEKVGGYLETSSDSYVSGVWDNTDQIWWVALDYLDECQPLKSICFMTPDEAKSYSGYYDRGHRADGEMSYPTIDNHYVYVQNWEEGDEVGPITGIGIARRTDTSDGKRYYRVIASSPGTDMLHDYDNENRQKQFHYHWGKEYRYVADSLKVGNNGPYEIGIKGMASSWDVDDHWFGHYWESSGVQDNWLLPAISRKPLTLPIEYAEPKQW